MRLEGLEMGEDEYRENGMYPCQKRNSGEADGTIFPSAGRINLHVSKPIENTRSRTHGAQRESMISRAKMISNRSQCRLLDLERGN